MSDELKLKEDIRKADHAKRIMEDPLVRSALDKMRATLYHNIETSGWRARGEREEAYRLLKLMGKFEAEFESHMRGGKIAASLLEDLKRKIMR